MKKNYLTKRNRKYSIFLCFNFVLCSENVVTLTCDGIENSPDGRSILNSRVLRVLRPQN